MSVMGLELCVESTPEVRREASNRVPQRQTNEDRCCDKVDCVMVEIDAEGSERGRERGEDERSEDETEDGEDSGRQHVPEAVEVSKRRVVDNPFLLVHGLTADRRNVGRT